MGGWAHLRLERLGENLQTKLGKGDQTLPKLKSVRDAMVTTHEADSVSCERQLGLVLTSPYCLGSEEAEYCFSLGWTCGVFNK